MNKRFKIIASVLVINIIFNSSFSTMATPQESSVEESKLKYQQLTTEIQATNDKVAILDIEIETINDNIALNNQELQSTQTEIEVTKDLLLQNENDMLEAENKLSTRVRSIYKSNITSNMLLFIINSESISDLFSRMNALTRIISLDKALMQDIEDKKAKLNDTIDTLKNTEDELIKIKEEIDLDLEQVQIKRSEQQVFLDELNEQKDAVFAIIEENEKTLVSHQLSVINSSNSSLEAIQNAIDTLNNLIPQLSSSYVIGLAQDAIYKGNSIIEEANKPTLPPPIIDTEGKATYTMESTAYTGGGLTAMGLKPVRIPDGISTVAVDPNVIPLGSKVFVSGYGVAIASDTGGAIKGHKIDVYLNTYNECITWGRRSVEVTVLAYPGEW